MYGSQNWRNRSSKRIKWLHIQNNIGFLFPVQVCNFVWLWKTVFLSVFSSTTNPGDQNKLRVSSAQWKNAKLVLMTCLMKTYRVTSKWITTRNHCVPKPRKRCACLLPFDKPIKFLCLGRLLFWFSQCADVYYCLCFTRNADVAVPRETGYSRRL